MSATLQAHLAALPKSERERRLLFHARECRKRDLTAEVIRTVKTLIQQRNEHRYGDVAITIDRLAQTVRELERLEKR